ncbi:MAG: hypothetical protein PUA96_05250 [Bacteroidales bacterium]|nr:hypothetical protein [Bacteroidales bacterium]
MKKFLSIISAIAVLSGLCSCEELDPTSLSGDSLPVKVTVAGHCRFVAKDKSGVNMNPEIVTVGTPVEILYGVPGADSKVEYALKAVKVNNEGYFETEIGCPAGKTLSVKVQSTFRGESYAKENNKSSYTMVETIFYGTVTESLSAGDAGYFDLKLFPHAYLGQEDLVQP